MSCTEDEDFMAAFDKMVLESVQTRAAEAVKTTQVIPIFYAKKEI